MKLIKQNDSAGGLIFKQNNNGKAMKQNYNFGRGFNKSLTNNCYIECPYVPQITDPFTILSFNELKNPIKLPKLICLSLKYDVISSTEIIFLAFT